MLMRRSLASLLLVLLVAPCALLFVGSRQEVPACCRRGGQHHCTIALHHDGFLAIAPECPYRCAAALISHSVTALRICPQWVLLNSLWCKSGYVGKNL
jgi:hypothetical protein